LEATQPPVTNVNERQIEAIRIIRNWCIADTVADRSKWLKIADAFVTGVESVEDTALAIKKNHPSLKHPPFITDIQGRDFLRFEQLYLERTDKTELQNCAWQDFAPRSVALDMVNKEHIGLESVVDLVFADPFYALQYQPTVTEQTHLRKLFDQISKDNTVFLIFGRPEMLYKFWFPIFQRGVASSKIEYKVTQAYSISFEVKKETTLLAISVHGIQCAKMR